MFILDGKPLSPDRAFTTSDGTQYPANWLRLSTPAEREALGITEVPDAPTYDQRFYWDVNLPKDHAQLVEQWTAQVKATAGSLLSQTDWYITRQAETGVAVPQSVLDRRSLIRYMSNDKEVFLALTASTEQLAEYVTSAAFNNWESGASIQQDEPSPEAPVSVSGIDVIDFSTSGTAITGSGLFGGSGEDTLTF
jgi:hypothetical protein